MLLLDTHVLLWWVDDDARLGAGARRSIQQSALVVVSAISAWEMAIKQALGRLAPPDVGAVLREQGFTALPFTIEHGSRAGALPLLHRDPFDRALVAQAMAGGHTLVTADDALAQYDVEVLDARS